LCSSGKKSNPTIPRLLLTRAILPLVPFGIEQQQKQQQIQATQKQQEQHRKEQAASIKTVFAAVFVMLLILGIIAMAFLFEAVF